MSQDAQSSPHSPSVIFDQDFEAEIENIPVITSQQQQHKDTEEDCNQLFKDKRRWKRACSSCQSRKLKCEWESLDLSSTLPCLRCQREKKDCVPGQRRQEKRGRKRKGMTSDMSVFYHTNKAAAASENPQSTDGYGNSSLGTVAVANASCRSDLYWMPTVQPKSRSQPSSSGAQCLNPPPRKISTSSPLYGTVAAAWNRSIYVTSGWLTASEAISYIE